MTSKIIPIAIKARIVMTLINANQNSNSPKSLTVNKFKPNKITKQTKAGIHCGISNQYRRIHQQQ